MPCTVSSKHAGMTTNTDSPSSGRSDIQRLRRQHAPRARFASDRIPADVQWLEPFKATLEKLELRAYWMRANETSPFSQEGDLPGRVHEMLCAFLRGVASSQHTCGRIEAVLGMNLPPTFRRRFDGWGRRWRQFLVAQGHLRRVGRSPATDALAAWLRSSRPLHTTTPHERQRLVQLLRGVVNDHARSPASGRSPAGNAHGGRRSTNAASLAALHSISPSMQASGVSSPESSYTSSGASSRDPSPPTSPAMPSNRDEALQR